MLCKCHWIDCVFVLYIAHTAFCLVGGGAFFSGHGVQPNFESQASELRTIHTVRYDRNLMKLCTVVWGRKTKTEFVGGQNPVMPSPILAQNRKIYNGAYGEIFKKIKLS